MNRKNTAIAIAIVLLIISVLVASNQIPKNGVEEREQPKFVIASWEYPDQYGQGIELIAVFENSTGSWVGTDPPVIYYDNSSSTFEDWGFEVAIKIIVKSWLNYTLVGADSVAEEKLYQQHNVVVTQSNGSVIFSQENFTYNAGLESGGLYWYEYEVILNFLPQYSQVYTATITYEVYSPIFDVEYLHDCSSVSGIDYYNNNHLGVNDYGIDRGLPELNTTLNFAIGYDGGPSYGNGDHESTWAIYDEDSEVLEYYDPTGPPYDSYTELIFDVSGTADYGEFNGFAVNIRADTTASSSTSNLEVYDFSLSTWADIGDIAKTVLTWTNLTHIEGDYMNSTYHLRLRVHAVGDTSATQATIDYCDIALYFSEVERGTSVEYWILPDDAFAEGVAYKLDFADFNNTAGDMNITIRYMVEGATNFFYYRIVYDDVSVDTSDSGYSTSWENLVLTPDTNKVLDYIYLFNYDTPSSTASGNLSVWIDYIEISRAYDDWVEVGVATLIFWLPIDPASLWALNNLYILLGAGLVIGCGVYLVKGGKNDLSMNKFYYVIVAFLIGWALIIGGVMP